MKLECTYKRIKPRDEIYTYCRSKLNKIEAFFNNSLHCRVNLIAERYDVKVEIRVDGDHTHYKSSASHESVYGAIDQAVEKMHKQLTKKKAKMKDRRIKRNKHESNFVDHEESQGEDLVLKKAN